MTKKALIIRRKSPVKQIPASSSTTNPSLAEMAGGTMAGIAAIACCAPYGVVNLLVIATYKVPAGLCRKAIRQRRRHRLIKSGMFPARSLSDSHLAELCTSAMVPLSEEQVKVDVFTEEELQEVEKEMWEHFSGAGF